MVALLILLELCICVIVFCIRRSDFCIITFVMWLLLLLLTL